MLTTEEHKNIENKWKINPTSIKLKRTRWWESETILEHISKIVCGKKVEGNNWIIHTFFQLNKKFPSAISIGCGTGNKEFALLQAGIVEHFYLFELSQSRLNVIMEEAKKKSLENRITCYYGDFFSSEYNKSNFYDLVFWSGSLHHMFDTKEALRVSHNILKEDGYILIDEFVGKSRFQFTDNEMEIVNHVRSSIPDELFFIQGTNYAFSKIVIRPTIEQMMQDDISEAADSENILPSIKEFFPHAEIIPYGGLIYHIALNDVLTNIPEQSEMLYSFLKIDDFTRKNNLHHYAFCFCSKNPIE